MLQLQKRILPISKTSYEMNSLAVLTKGLFYYIQYFLGISSFGFH
jgi:hypothetical protein